MKKSPLFIALLILISNPLVSQEMDMKRMSELSHAKGLSALTELRNYLAIPNDANFADHVKANVFWTEEAFKKRGFTTSVLPTSEEGPPILIAEMSVPEATRTILFYMQVDGQPVDPTKWQQKSPYQSVIKEAGQDAWSELPWSGVGNDFDDEWRIFARSASDAKGPIIMFLTAIDIMKEQGLQPSYNIKAIFDFEEEQGSPNLPDAVVKYKSELSADWLVILDGPRHPTNQPTITFGARGITAMTLTVFGPKFPQHSGHYGNYIPNPALRLSKLLASMKDDAGRVTIPGFYDGIEISNSVRKVLESVPDDEEEILRSIGVKSPDKVAPTLQEAIQYPSLNIRGMQSAWVGEQRRTIIPATATAEIDIRLVIESDSDRLTGLVRDHIEQEGYYIIDRPPTDEERTAYDKIIMITSRNSYKAFRTKINSDVGKFLNKALVRAFEKDPVIKRTSGGSIPISPFVSTLGIPAVTVPTVNPDNNQHSPNENLRLGNLREGIRTMLAILTQR